MDASLPFLILEKIQKDVRLNDGKAAERYFAMLRSGCNIFKSPARFTDTNLESDSGTGPLSEEQMECLVSGNERQHRAYASRTSFEILEWRMAELFGLGIPGEDFYFFPFPQGRVAESVFFGCLKDAIGQGGARMVIPSNSHFDTTRANIELAGFEARDIPAAETRSAKEAIFGGNMDIVLLDDILRRRRVHGDVPVVFMTVTNNTRGGLPVSMENLHDASWTCRRFDTPFFLDAARFAENAYFIRQHEPRYRDKSIREIVHEMVSYCDGFLISFKKDGLSHIGGGLVVKCDSILVGQFPDLIDAIETRETITVSNPTQGGIPGGYQLAIAEGLCTATTLEYLDARVSQVARFGQMFKDAGIPVLEPFGGHAVYLDTDRFFADTKMRREDFGGIALTALLLLYGVRACELGAFAFGKYNPATKKEAFPDFNYVRFAIPRRDYTDAELALAVDAVKSLHEMRHEFPRAVPVYGRSLPLRHFKARFELQQL